MDIYNPRLVVLAMLSAVVLTSGCLQTEKVNLSSDFGLDYQEADLNSSGNEIYREAMNSGIENYSVDAESRMAMNLPVITVATNITSVGAFKPESSEINSTGSMMFGFGDKSNSTRFSTSVRTQGDRSTVTTEIKGKENTTEREAYSRERLGFSLEALRVIEVENATALGITNNREIVLQLDADDLIENSQNIFEVHSPVQESVDGKGMNSSQNFNSTKTYLWVDREDRTPSKFAYYGAANGGTLQIRTVIEYRQ